MQQNDQGQQPFFAQFLTSARSSDVQHNTTPIKDHLQTHKYPSDNDEEPPSALIPE